MTLIVAAKQPGGKSVFILSDTKISDPAKVSTNGYAEALVKCYPLSTKLIVSFAGDVELGMKGVELVRKCKTRRDAIEGLLSLHMSSNQRVDFILCDSRSRTLFSIEGGEYKQVKKCWIGNKDAYLSFQKILHQPEPRSTSCSLKITKIGDKDSPEICHQYSEYLDAFHELVMQNKYDVGGICIPYLVTKRSQGFGTYLRSYRPALSAIESNVKGPVDFMFNRTDLGTFTINFGGDENSFTAQIPQSGYKLSFNSDGLPRSRELPSMGFGLN